MQQNRSPELNIDQKLWLSQRPTLSRQVYGDWFVDFDKELQGFVVREIRSHVFNQQHWYGSEHLINRKVKINHNTLHQKLEDISRIQLSLTPINNFHGGYGQDGTKYMFLYSSGNWAFRLNWWSHHPSEWQPIVKWFNNCLEWLLSELNTGWNQRIEKP